MANHLTDKNVLDLVKLIDGWDLNSKFTWGALCVCAEKKLSLNTTRQTLQKFTRIKDAYLDKKEILRTGLSKPKTPPSLKIAARRIATLEEENARLLREQDRLLAQFQVWQYNSYAHGVTVEMLNRALPAKG